jgi:GTP-binding protein
MGSRCFGRDGNDIEIPVPPGTVIKDAKTGEIIQDLTGMDRFVFLKGGRGGQGNYHFKTATRQTPRFAQPGEKGVEMRIGVELLVIADIGFVGFPNAGKSSLLNNLTNARTKVAGYPFTTKIPQLGMFRYDDSDMVLADIPGIIEGASQGAGMGYKFLRHISRTVALAFFIDLSDDSYLTAYPTLLDELKSYAPSLIEKPLMIIGTKIDEEGTEERLKELQQTITDYTVLPLSNITGEGLLEIKHQFVLITHLDESKPADEGFTAVIDTSAEYRETF